MAKNYKAKMAARRKKYRKAIRASRYPKRPSRLSGTMLGKSFGFPKQLKFKHVYCETFNFTSTTGALANYQFRANSLYDPNLTGGGHYAKHFNTLKALYDHYTVIGSKITYEIVPSGETVQAPYKLATYINDDSTVGPSFMAGIEEQKGAQVRMCTGGINPSKIWLSQKWSAKKTFGGSVLGNDELKGTPTTNPTEQSIFTLMLQALDLVSTVSVHVRIKISYIAIWRELKDVSIDT